MTAGRTVNTLSQDWGTPLKYVETVKSFFGGEIDLDPCSNDYSLVEALNEYALPVDGLAKSWNFARIFVNPPYGADRQRKHWLFKCEEAHRCHNSEVLALIPIAANTSHWKHYIFGKATAIAFLYDTRLKFLVDGTDAGKGAPMACCMVYWGKEFDRFWKTFNCHGAVADIRHLINTRIDKTHEIGPPLAFPEYQGRLGLG